MLFANPCSYYVPSIKGYHVHVYMYMFACIKLMFAQTGLHVHILYQVPRDQGLGIRLVSRVCMAGIVSTICFSGYHIFRIIRVRSIISAK